MQQNPAIVIIAYNRLHCLQRLMNSVLAAYYPSEVRVPLIISIDKSDSDEVRQYAEGLEWTHGDKRVITHIEHLGLKEHVLRCGDLTLQYNSIIMLEDDLLVSPWFYDYAIQAVAFYSQDAAVAGVSLYRYQYTENYYYPFQPLDDDSDVHFLQIPSSWGQIFFKKIWMIFREWMSRSNGIVTEALPGYLSDNWTNTSWKKHFADYLINEGLYFVYPNTALSTDYGDSGTHSVHKGLFQVVLQQSKKGYRFRKFDSNGLFYDCNFEVNPIWIAAQVPALPKENLTIDLYGTKKLSEIKSTFLLSSKACSKPLKSWGNNLSSAIQNVLLNDMGDFFFLGYKSDFGGQTPERINFHPPYLSISRILENSYVADTTLKIAREMFSEWTDKENHNRTHASFLVIVFSNEEHSSHQLTSSTYSNERIEFCKFHIKQSISSLVELINNSKADFYVLLKESEQLHTHTLATVNSIVQKYPDIHWLTGIQTITTRNGFQVNNQTTPSRRWNEHIFHQSLYGRTGRYIPSGATFFKRYLWDLAKDELNITSIQTFCEDLWAVFFKYQKLYTIDAYLSTATIDRENLVRYNKKTDLLETNSVNRMLEWFFLRNIPVLRAYYKERNELAPVVRYDFKTQSHWLSEY